MELPVISEESNNTSASFNGGINNEGLAAGPNLYEVPSGITEALQSTPPSDAFPTKPAPLNPDPHSAEALSIALPVAPLQPPASPSPHHPPSRQQSNENTCNPAAAIQAGEAQATLEPRDEGLTPLTPHIVQRDPLGSAPFYQLAGRALPTVGEQVDTKNYVIRPSPLEISRGCIILRYSAAADRYERPFGKSQVINFRKLYEY